MSVNLADLRSPRSQPSLKSPKTRGKLSPIVSSNYEAVCERLSIILASRLIMNPVSTLGVTVGTTPTGVYSQLSALARKGTLDFTSTHLCLLDEFFGNDNLPQSPHRKELESVFLDQFPATNKPKMISAPGDLPVDKALSSFKQMASYRKLDYAIVHCGSTGNIGWIRETEIQGVHRVNIESAEDEQSKGYKVAISMGLEDLMHAKEVFIMAIGRNKANIVQQILEDTHGQNPVSWLLHNHPNVNLFIDKSAAAQLPEQESSPNRINGFDIISLHSDILKEQNIVCFSPHPDDSCISCGATLSFLSTQNNSVTSAVCTTGHRSYIPDTSPEERIKIREKEATDESTILGTNARFLALPLYDKGGNISDDDLNIIVKLLKETDASVLFLPQTGDTHATHRAVCKAILLSLQKLMSEGSTNKSYEMYMYEGPWSIFGKGNYNTICNPPAEHFAKKMAAIGAHVSQTDRTPYGVAAESLALLRGALVPEQDLAGFGANPPRLNERLEVFFHFSVKTSSEVAKFLNFLDSCQAPRVF